MARGWRPAIFYGSNPCCYKISLAKSQKIPYSFPDMKTKVYSLSNSFREVRLATSRTACFINTPSGAIQMDRLDAANSIRYARAKGRVTLIK
jgi:hypothetical protein